MTAKRFVDYFDKDHNYIIQDLQNEDEYQVGFVNCDEDVFLELINQLNDENEELKKEELVGEPLELFKQNMLLKQNNGKLREENYKIKSLLLKKVEELNNDYNESARAGMPTGGVIGELDSFEGICRIMGWIE